MSPTTKALKFLDEGAIGPYSGFQWPVPKDGKPGKWVSAKGALEACRNGIHACTLEQSVRWLRSECYVIELGGRVVDEGDKLVARKGRLLYRTALDDCALRLFAADCAEHVLPIFEATYPNDGRPRKAIEVVRAFANGKATTAELDAAQDATRDATWAAARDATRAATQDATWDATWDAARAVAQAATQAATRTAAWNAAQAAAWAAAWDAAQAAAWDAEHKWQIRRLRHYLKLPKGWDE